MADLSDLSSDQEMASSSGSVTSSDRVMTCADCGTTKTPLWRGGPAGPKSLCNACGIRSRKKRTLLSINKASSEHKKTKKINTIRIISTNNTESGENISTKLEDSIKNKFLTFRILTWQKRKVRRKLGKEERAAMLLMALSCSSIYAFN